MLKQDEIIELAKSINEDWWLDDIDLQAFAKLVAAASASKAVEREREACAKLCEETPSFYITPENCAIAIRARGQT